MKIYCDRPVEAMSFLDSPTSVGSLSHESIANILPSSGSFTEMRTPIPSYSGKFTKKAHHLRIGALSLFWGHLSARFVRTALTPNRSPSKLRARSASSGTTRAASRGVHRGISTAKNVNVKLLPPSIQQVTPKVKEPGHSQPHGANHQPPQAFVMIGPAEIIHR